MVRVYYESAGYPRIATVETDFDATCYLGWRCEWHSEHGKIPLVILEEATGGTAQWELKASSLKRWHPVFNAASFSLAKKAAEYYFADDATVIAQMLPPPFVARATKKSEKTASDNGSAVAPIRPELNAKQQEIADSILSTTGVREHLIWGVTGSGKTRIYEYLIAESLSRGEQVLLLVPEIALSSQVMDIIRQRFYGQSVLYHSGLNNSERFYAQQAFLGGKAAIAIGTRSAIFLAASRLGLVIIDEEHDAAFKELRQLRYDTRVLARMRLSDEPARLVLGSATPSLESLVRAKSGEARLYRLRERATGQTLPKVLIPEYREQHGLISPLLMEKMHEHLAEKNQVLLLMNRRGHSTHVHCATCATEQAHGYAECPRCSVALTYHKDNTLRCHHCGYIEPFSHSCPKDGTPRRLSGRGIQKVEDILEAKFGSYSYARLDRDTTQQKQFAAEVLAGMRARAIDILIGTQMIAKGFDLEHVTLVGVLAIDPLLNAPDYRASEQAWQLLAQVIGRAGRHKPGEVVIQTMQPHHPVIRSAAEHNADDFYAHEAAVRRLTGYPPFGVLARLLLQSKEEEHLIHFAETLSRAIFPINTQDLFSNSAEPIELLGPAFPTRRKLENEFRVHFLVKSPSEKSLRNYLRRILPLCEQMARTAGKIGFHWDIDPREMG